MGALTFGLARRAKRLIALETDRSLVGPLKDRLGREFKDKVAVLHQDALAFDLAEAGDGLVLMGNLPYQISSPLLFKIIEAGSVVDRAVVTLQRELADRIVAGPGPKIYGLISVMIQLKARVTGVLNLSAGAFHPRPKVASKTIRLDLGQPPPIPLLDETAFKLVARAAFGQRRKTLRQALLSAPLGPDREDWEEIFREADQDPRLRAEKLSVEDFIRLANGLTRKTSPAEPDPS